MAQEHDERLSTELALLETMYPDQMKYQPKGRELSYSTEGADFTLRLPDDYLNEALPETLSANAGKVDLRNQLKTEINRMALGEEILDSIILSFNDLVGTTQTSQPDPSVPHDISKDTTLDKKATIIVWLHHLLNTNKRKQALSPPSAGVSGLTKPGYPGVLIYSGTADAVHEHVNELKQLNWQAFQVRFDSEEEWRFAHGAGVKEVEAMKDVVAGIGEEKKEVFLEAMRMK